MDSFSNDSNERRGTSRKRRSLALIAREAPIARREPGRQLLKVAVGGQDLAVAVMVIPCLTVGGRVELLADCGERDLVGEEPRGGAGRQLLLAQPDRTGRARGQAEGAALRFTHMPKCGRFLRTRLCTGVHNLPCS